jgi:S1-C subfamily serine protease/HEAT repeat protein
MPRTCPKCRANLTSVPVRNGKLRCPECGALFVIARAEERFQATPTPGSRRANIEVESTRSRGADEEPPGREESSAWPMMLILAGVGVGLMLLLALGGAVGVFLYFKLSAQTLPQVASERPEAPREVVPVAQANPQPDKEPIPPAPPAQGAAAGPNTLPLKELKAATVYIKGETATTASRGSGFVVRSQGNAVYIATNHHVITPPKDEGDPFPPFFIPRMPGMPRGPRMPGMPRGPILPNFPRGMGGPFGSQDLQLTVVFNSGSTKEQSLPATVVADDSVNDLAILRATGVADAPRPIDYQRTPELHETMAAVAFGFPFGEKLDLEKKNPSVTVTKGAISSLRGEGGQLGQVQLDLDLNPGNSGGPIVDERGNLIGVAVAKWGQTRIGFAVPVPKLKQLLQGRIDPPKTTEWSKVGDQLQVRIRAPASDPFGQLRSPTLLYGLANEVRMPPKGPNGWAAMSGAKSSALTLNGTQAIANFSLTPPAGGPFQIIAQVSYQNAEGQTIYSEPRTLSLSVNVGNDPLAGVGGSQPSKPGSGPAVAAQPARTPRGEELTKLLADLKSANETTRQRAASVLQQAPPRQRREEVRHGLQDLLSAKDPATRTAGIQALAACDPKEAGPHLAKLLADNELAVRQAAAHSLKELRDPRVAEAAAARLSIEPGTVLDVLKAIGPAAEKAVLPYLDDKHKGQARFWAFEVLKEIGTEASLPALQAVQGPEANLARITIEEIRGRLPLTADEWSSALDDLKSNDPFKRARAVRRIAATPPSQERRADVLARLEMLLNDHFPDVCAAAIKGIGRWSGPSAVAVLSKAMEGFNPPMHDAAIEVLAEMKSAEAAAAIAKRLPDIHDRDKATKALKAMDPKVAEKAVLPLLDTTNDFGRGEAIKVLADVGGRDSIAPLEKLAKDNNVFYSGKARQAIEAIKDRSDNEK